MNACPFRRIVVAVASVIAVASCSGGSSPTAPSATPTQGASLEVSSFVVTAQQPSAGTVAYTFAFELHETSGRTALTVNTIQFLLAGVGTANAELTGTVRVPAGGTRSSDALSSSDSSGRPVASQVTITVAFTDDTGKTGSASKTVAVSQAAAYTVFGVVSSSAGSALSGATVRIGDRSAGTDGNGYYTIPGVPAGAITVTASKTGYTAQAVAATLSGDRQINFTMPVRVEDVEYRVSGSTTRSNIITYSGAGESTQQAAHVTLPWSFSFSGARTGQFLYVSAQNDLATGCIHVTILRNGITFKEAESCGAYVIATASGSY